MFVSWLALALTQLPPHHPPLSSDGGAPPSAASLLHKLDATADLKTRDKPFEIATSLARLYLEQDRLDEATLFFEQALAKGAALRSRWATLKAQAPAKPSEGCIDLPLVEVETKSAKGEARTAAACALAGIRALVDVDVQLGHIAFVRGDSAKAAVAYGRAVSTLERHVDARYARGALLLDTDGDSVASLNQAKDDLSFVVAEAPTGPKSAQAKRLLERAESALKAGGLSKLAPAPVAAVPSAPALRPEMVEAFQNTPRTPELEASWLTTLEAAESFLARGEAQQALDSYKQVMPYQPSNPRVRAGMAWSLVKLGKPMADRVWTVAAETPGALKELANVLRAKGNTTDADALEARLASTAH